MIRMNKSKVSLVAAAAAFAILTGLAPRAHADATTDGQLLADHRGYAAQQAEIAALNATGTKPLRGYSISKAQCWLDVSFHEYTRNDRSAFPAEALQQSAAITAYLRAGGAEVGPQNPARETPLVNGATKLRDDLWERAARVKGGPGAECAAQLVACGEVELVHAGNEFAQQGWRHAKPYIQMAEDKLTAAEAAAERCRPAVAPAAAVAPPPPPPPPTPKKIERISLGAEVLFAFDRRGPQDMLPAGRERLHELALRLGEAYSKVDTIKVIGHTDRLGSRAYNDQLSKDRATTVAGYLKGLGVGADIEVRGMADTQPVVTACVGQARTPALIECLQPNRRVELVIEGDGK